MDDETRRKRIQQRLDRRAEEDPAWKYGLRDPSIPTIQAVDTEDETLYVLRRPGKPTVTAHWPHPLRKLCPEAVTIPAYQPVLGEPVGRALTVAHHHQVPDA